LTYHYLVAETFRSTAISPEAFWQLSKAQQADLVWQTLFVENSPLSEATCGVITVLNAFGLDTNAENEEEETAEGVIGGGDRVPREEKHDDAGGDQSDAGKAPCTKNRDSQERECR